MSGDHSHDDHLREDHCREDHRREERLERELSYSVILSQKAVPLEHLLQYSVGSVIVLDRADRPVRLEVEGCEVGAGTTVRQVGEKRGPRLGLRIDDVRSPESFLPELLP